MEREPHVILSGAHWERSASKTVPADLVSIDIDQHAPIDPTHSATYSGRNGNEQHHVKHSPIPSQRGLGPVGSDYPLAAGWSLRDRLCYS